MVQNVKHTRIGLWDLYEDQTIHTSPTKWPSFRPIIDALPYVWRMLKDIAAIRACWPLLLALLAVEFLSSIVPAIHLSFSGKLLDVVQTAIDHRTVDTNVLVTVVIGTFISSVATRLLVSLKQLVSTPLHLRIKAHYSVHIFGAIVRLDVPTFDDPAIQRQLEQSFPNHSNTSIAFSAVTTLLHIVTTAIQLVSQISVLYSVLKSQTDGPLLAILCSIAAFFQWKKVHTSFYTNGVWVATTKDRDYVKAEGLKRTVDDPAHRKEIVASGIAPFLLAQYRESVSRTAHRAGNFFELINAKTQSRDFFSFDSFFHEFLRCLPEVVFTLRAVQHPTSIPVSLASLQLITTTTKSFTYTAFSLVDDTGSVSDRLNAVKQLYQVANIRNRIQVHSVSDEGDEDSRGQPYPENDRTLAQGISIEFINVSFIYPGSEMYALRNVSFKIERGQLCVIVGNNGSGKSTILKLIARLYDPTEGAILIDGIDIKTLRLADLRRAISVLFQDYTHFPLSIQDNIGLGNPAHAADFTKIERAAQLGGADTFIQRLPDKYESYLDRPVQDYYSVISDDIEGMDFARVRKAAGISTAEGGGGVGNRGLSGGQMQRIALSRMFMRSVVSDQSVGLLLFDEPSASLDPTAEHDLFERLRTLRGNKTMVFSSHRFGNLTRHADLILYMNDSLVVEEGTHDYLIRHKGEYARIWMLQAQAFL